MELAINCIKVTTNIQRMYCQFSFAINTTIVWFVSEIFTRLTTWTTPKKKLTCEDNRSKID